MIDLLLIEQTLKNQFPESKNIDYFDFYHKNKNIVGPKRENDIFDIIISGGLPNFLRFLKPIEIIDEENTLIYFVMSDYLSIGNDQIYLRIPMVPKIAQKIADHFNCSLPTTKMVKQIWEKSEKLSPIAMPGYNMASTETYKIHSEKIDKSINSKYELLSGHKKDIVLTNSLTPSKIAIYGWFYPDGKPIQGLNATSHDVNYVDYSHGVRLISNKCYLNGEEITLQDLFKDPKYAGMINSDGILRVSRY